MGILFRGVGNAVYTYVYRLGDHGVFQRYFFRFFPSLLRLRLRLPGHSAAQ